MADKKEFKVWGYPAKTEPDWSLRGQLIGSADQIEDAHRLKDSATAVGWGTVIILEDDSIVE